MDPAVQDTVDYVALQRLHHSYADIVNRRAWAELPEIFRPDTTVVVDVRDGSPRALDGPTAVGEFIGGALQRFDFFELVILSARLFLRHDGDADRAAGRLYMCEQRHEEAIDEWTTAYGVYHDQFARVDGRWWFAGRRYHSLARRAATTEVFPFPTQ